MEWTVFSNLTSSSRPVMKTLRSVSREKRSPSTLLRDLPIRFRAASSSSSSAASSFSSFVLKSDQPLVETNLRQFSSPPSSIAQQRAGRQRQRQRHEHNRAVRRIPVRAPSPGRQAQRR
jgi:hypothetical protein